MPVGRVERPAGLVHRPTGDHEAGSSSLPSIPSSVHIFWQPSPPGEESPERALFEQLSARGLLLEPFDRAGDALREIYGPRSEDS